MRADNHLRFIPTNTILDRTRYAFLALGLGAVFYALPIAVISAELACAVPYDGGLVAWVEEACGPRIGGHNVWWLWISSVDHPFTLN